MNDLSAFLFAEPSFAEGAGRIFDFGNTLSLYNESPTPEAADFFAIWADCALVGNEMTRGVIDSVEAGETKAASAKSG